MPIGPELGMEKCKKLATPIIAKIDKFIRENDKGQTKLVMKLKVPEEIHDYLIHLYREAGWSNMRIMNKPPPEQIVLYRNFDISNDKRGI